MNCDDLLGSRWDDIVTDYRYALLIVDTNPLEPRLTNVNPIIMVIVRNFFVKFEKVSTKDNIVA